MLTGMEESREQVWEGENATPCCPRPQVIRPELLLIRENREWYICYGGVIYIVGNAAYMEREDMVAEQNGPKFVRRRQRRALEKVSKVHRGRRAAVQ